MSAREQLAALDAAIARVEAKLDDMRQRWSDADAPCCPGCMFGQDWQRLAEKLSRQMHWRTFLAARVRP